MNVIYQCGNLADQWSVSPEVTAARMVLVVAVLRVLGLFSEYTESAAKLVTFYSNLPQNAQLPTFRRPSFVYLAKQWLLSSSVFSCLKLFSPFPGYGLIVMIR